MAIFSIYLSYMSTSIFDLNNYSINIANISIFSTNLLNICYYNINSFINTFITFINK